MASPTALENTRAVAEPSEARPGQTFTLNLTFTVKPGLHIQAHKPLQEGLIGTELTAPPTDGITWKQPQYPPGQERVDELFGTLLEYRGQVQIQLEGVVNPTAQTGRRAIPLKLRYQACNEDGSCFPPNTETITANLTVLPPAAVAASGPAGLSGAVGQGDTAPSSSGGGVEAPAGTAKPAPAPIGNSARPPAGHLPWQPFSTRAVTDLTAAGKTVLIDFTADWCPNCKFNELTALNTQATADLVARNGVTPLLADFTREDPEILAWLQKFDSISVPLTVIIPGKNPSKPIILRDTYRQQTLLNALETAGPSRALASSRSGLTLDTPLELNESAGSTWLYLLFGFAGGFILNFMPCVLPVISIKILSLVGQAGQSPRRVLGLGVAFAAGMIALFLVLGILVTTAGQTWGALFQSTTFLLVMLGILVAMSASLFGAFTLAVPSAVGEADAAIEGEGYVGSFGKGVLAVLLGTPCSGPFLGSALAWAAAKSAAGQPYLGMLIFLSMGLGMALPFVVLAAKPNWMRFIPRPGPWMETFKQFMGFLLLLTAVYILSILQADLVKWAILYAFGVAFAAWLYGRLVRPDRSTLANWAGRTLAVVVLAAAVWISFGSMLSTDGRTSAVVGQTGAMVTPSR